MIAKTIPFNKLKQAIAISFDGDNKIFDLYDPTKQVETLEEIVEDISRKILGYEDAIFYGIYEKNKLIGYFARQQSLLISFSLAMQYRTRSNLREFFRLMKTTIKKPFICFLWAKNIRAAKYLMKNKMELVSNNDNIIKLQCQ